jgi:hypothetical protein
MQQVFLKSIAATGLDVIRETNCCVDALTNQLDFQPRTQHFVLVSGSEFAGKIVIYTT